MTLHAYNINAASQLASLFPVYLSSDVRETSTKLGYKFVRSILCWMPIKLIQKLALSLALTLTYTIVFTDTANAKESHWATPVKSNLTKTDSILKDWSKPVYIGTVLESSAPGTYGKPPSSIIDFQQTLRGIPIVGPRTVIWTHIVTVVTVLNAECNTKPYDPNRDCKLVPYEPHLAEPSTPPPVGEKLIIATFTPANVTKHFSYTGTIPGISELLAKEGTVVGYVAYPATAQHLATFEKHALLEERFARKNSLILFFLVVATSVAALIYAFITPKISVYYALAMFSIYILYESGIDIQENIRVDLIIIFPLMLIGIASGVVSLFRKPKKALIDLADPNNT